MTRIVLLVLCLGIVADAYFFDSKYLHSSISVLQKVTTAIGQEVQRTASRLR